MRPPPLSLITSFNKTKANNNNLNEKRNIINYWLLYKNDPNFRKFLKSKLPSKNRNNEAKLKTLFFAHHNQPWVRQQLLNYLNKVGRSRNRSTKKRRIRTLPRKLTPKSRKSINLTYKKKRLSRF